MRIPAHSSKADDVPTRAVKPLDDANGDAINR
jgi:hypothetical protein